MDKNIDNGKYLLKSELRTWSELKKQRALEAAKANADAPQPHHPVVDPKRRNTLSQFLPNSQPTSNPLPPRKWGGCVAGCDHKHDRYPRRKLQAQPPSVAEKEQYEGEDHPIAHQEEGGPTTNESISPTTPNTLPIRPGKTPTQLFAEHYGGTDSGAPTPHERPSDGDGSGESDYFDSNAVLPSHRAQSGAAKRPPRRKPTEEDLERWANESGMGSGERADALGDEPEEGEEEEEEEGAKLEEQEKHNRSLRGSVY